MPFRCSCTSGFLFFCSNCFLFRNFQRVIVNTFKIFSCGYSEAIYLFCDNTQMGNVPKMDRFKITVYTYTHTYTWLALFFLNLFSIFFAWRITSHQARLCTKPSRKNTTSTTCISVMKKKS